MRNGHGGGCGRELHKHNVAVLADDFSELLSRRRVGRASEGFAVVVAADFTFEHHAVLDNDLVCGDDFGVYSVAFKGEFDEELEFLCFICGHE